MPICSNCGLGYDLTGGSPPGCPGCGAGRPRPELPVAERLRLLEAANLDLQAQLRRLWLRQRVAFVLVGLGLLVALTPLRNSLPFMSSQTIRASNFVVTDSDGRVHGVFGFQRVADGQGDSTLRPTAPKQVKLVNRLPHLELPVGIDVVDYRLREPFSAEFGDNLIADDFMVFPACLDVPRWTKLWESEFSNARHVPNLARRLIRQQQSDESMANRVAQRFFIVESRIKRLETKVGIE